MPRIKRWHPISHDFNHDAEVRELRSTFGDWLGYAWQELLSIGDRNDGVIKGSDEHIGAVMGRTSMGRRLDLNSKQARLALDWMVEHGWVKRCFDGDSPAIRIANHSKYHKTRDDNKIPRGNSIASLPSEPSEPSYPKDLKNADQTRATPAIFKHENGNGKSDKPKYPWGPVADRLYASDPEAFKRIVAFVNAAAKEGYSHKVITDGLERLEDAIKNGLVNGEWWPYARECVKKAGIESEERTRDRNWQNQKGEEKNFIANLVGGLSRAKGS